MCAQVASVPQVTVDSAAPSGAQSGISFSIPSPVSGVVASYTQLLFKPGSYQVTVNFPPGYSGTSIAWSGQVPPSGSVGPGSGSTWVRFGLVNSGTNDSYVFDMWYTSSGHGPAPIIVSDPPPSVVFQSS